MFELLTVVAIVLLGSALCSGIETALLSVPLIRVQQLAQSRQLAAATLLAIREKINRPIATIVVLNNIFNIVGSIMVGHLATATLGDAWLGIFSGVLTFLIIVFGEILPKTIGERYAEPIALLAALPVKGLTVLMLPLVLAIEWVTAPFTRGKRRFTTTEAEIQLLAKIGRQEGIIGEGEAEMIQRVFRLNDMIAADLMSPRVTITHIRSDLTLAEAKWPVLSSQHSRIIVIGDSLDDVLGVVLKSEVMAALIEGQVNRKIATLTRPVRFVPETVHVDKLLKDFLNSREHIAVVLDEYGVVAGVITLEDVLEVLTGEIVDETDRYIDLQEAARRRHQRLLNLLEPGVAQPGIAR